MRRQLHAAWPYCHWCGIETRLVWPAPRTAIPDDVATLDHIFDWFDERRLGPGGEAVVLACRGCNAARGRASVLANLRVHQWKTRLGIRGPLSMAAVDALTGRRDAP